MEEVKNECLMIQRSRSILPGQETAHQGPGGWEGRKGENHGMFKSREVCGWSSGGLGTVETVKDEIGSITQGQERNGFKNQA